jgi:hypothetical protein
LIPLAFSKPHAWQRTARNNAPATEHAQQVVLLTAMGGDHCSTDTIQQLLGGSGEARSGLRDSCGTTLAVKLQSRSRLENVSVSNSIVQEDDGQFLLRRYRDGIFADKATGGCRLLAGLPVSGYIAGIDPITAVIFVAIAFAVYGIMVLLRQL